MARGRFLLEKGANSMIVSCDDQRTADIAASRGNCVMQDTVESFNGERVRGDVGRGVE